MGAATGISLSSSSAGFTFKEPMFSSSFLIKVVPGKSQNNSNVLIAAFNNFCCK